MREKIFYKILFFLVLWLLPLATFASGPILDAANNFDDLDVSGLQAILINIANIFLALLGVIAVLMALWGAFLFITAGDNKDQVARARKTLLFAVIGVAIAIVAFGVVSFTESLLSNSGGSSGGGAGGGGGGNPACLSCVGNSQTWCLANSTCVAGPSGCPSGTPFTQVRGGC